MPMHNNAPSLEEVMQRLANEGEASPGHDMGLTWVIAKNILRIFSIIPRALFLRSGFGERYMQAYHVAGSWAVVAVIVTGASLSDVKTPWNEGGSNTTIAGVVLLIAYSVMLALRYFGVLRRRWANDFSVHSYSEGTPWWLWRKLSLPGSVVSLAIEPLIVLLSFYLLSRLLDLPSFQLLGLIGATALFAEANIIAAQERARLLDAADNIIEKRMAEERLGLVQGHAKHTPSIAAAPAADQQALLRELGNARAQAATLHGSAAPAALPEATGGE